MEHVYKFSGTACQLIDICNSKAYQIRKKLNDGAKLSREEKNFITKGVNNNSYFNKSIPLRGWQFDFSDVLHHYIITDNRGLHPIYITYFAIDKTSLRAILYLNRKAKILELK